MRPVLSPTPAGLAHPHPVRRTQARARVLGLVDEGLQQPGPVAAEALEVFPHRPRRPAQHMRGQVAADNVGTNQKPAQPHHSVQVGASARVVPADPGVAGLQAPGGCREPDAAQPTVRGADQIAQLMADERPPTAGVLVFHQCIPDPTLRVGLDPNQHQVPELADLVRHIVRRRHRVREHPRPAHPGAPALRQGQRDMALRLQLAQGLSAACALPPAAGITQIERITDAIGDPPEGAHALRSCTVQHVVKSGKISPQAAPDLILNLHCHAR